MQKNIVIDERLSSYQSFFDHGWSRRVNEKAEGTPLDPIVFDLALTWKGISVNHQTPWLLVETIKSFSAGTYAVEQKTTGKMVRAVGVRLLKEVGESLEPHQRERLTQAAEQVAADCDKLLPTLLHEFPVQEIWDQYRGLPQLAMAVWNTQRLCFGGLYYAYENFLLRAYELAAKEEDYRIRTKTFGKDLTAIFGDAVGDRCWTDPQVNAARLVRNVLVHNGGRVTDEVGRLGLRISVIEGELQIMAPDTVALFEVLKEKVEWFVNTTTRGVFKRPA